MQLALAVAAFCQTGGRLPRRSKDRHIIVRCIFCGCNSLVPLIFVRINKDYQISILLNIHHIDLALQYCDRVIGVRAGEIVFDGPASTITQEQIDYVYNGTKAPTMGDGE